MYGDFADSVMVALLPITTDWCQIECPHMTVVYVGERPALDPSTFNELAKDASAMAALCNPFYLRVTGIEVMGEAEKVNVLTLLPTPELWALRQGLETWSASEYPFKPHCTIGPVGTPLGELPRYLAFNRLLVAWGDDRLDFSLNK